MPSAVAIGRYPEVRQGRRGLVDGIAGVAQDDDRALGRAQTREGEADGESLREAVGGAIDEVATGYLV